MDEYLNRYHFSKIKLFFNSNDCIKKYMVYFQIISNDFKSQKALHKIG